MSARDKIKTIDEIAKITKSAKAAGKKVVTTNGTFDLIHVGHVRYLEEAKALGDILIVGINSDRSTKAYKGPTRPILGEEDRAEIIAGLESVDYVFIFDEPDPRPWLQKIHTDVHAKGGDWKNPDPSRAIHTMIEAPLLKEKGAEFILIDFVPGKSTSAIIEKIKKSA